MDVLLVGIAGPSGAGKSTFCRRLERSHSNVGRLKLDDYFCDLDEVEIINGFQNWDDPKHINWTDLILAAKELKKGKPVISPHYDRSIDQCIGEKCILPKEIILVDGFLTLHHPELQEIIDLSFFFDLDEGEQINRRKERQSWVEEGYLQQIMIPNARKYVMPTKEFADYVIDASLVPEGIYAYLSSVINNEKALISTNE